MRLNRAGIPVLDPPGRNGLPKSCLPGKHNWGPPLVVSRQWVSDWMEDAGGYVLVRYQQTCRRCRERDAYTRRGH